MGYFKNRRQKKREKALMYAVKYDHVEDIRALLDEGVDINVRNGHTDHFTPLTYAVARGSANAVQCLIERKADLEKTGYNGMTPLTYALWCKKSDIVNLLLEARTDMKNTLGFVINHNGEKEIIRDLIARGAEMGPLDAAGNTPLHLAAKMGRRDFCEMLLAAGADSRAMNNNGDTPAHSARAANFHGLADFLETGGVQKTPEPSPAPAISPAEDPWRMPEEQSGKEIARVSINKAIGYRLTEIFNFEMQTYTRLAQNIGTKAESQVMKSFDEFSDTAFIEHAREEYKKRGGTLPDKPIGGLAINKPRPAQKA
jgi:hypothetical protein